MSRAASAIPAEGALLCEGCGYILTGLPANSRCPECSQPIFDSHPSRRTLPPWELYEASAWSRFWTTSAMVLFHPTRFFRSLATRVESTASTRFVRWHYRLASLLLSLAACLHVHWIRDLSFEPRSLIIWAWLYLLSYLFLRLTIAVAARLTSFEAGYRGHRLPLGVVRRGLDYHAAHYLPVALLAVGTVAGYQILLSADILTGLSATRYIYLLCAEVIVAASYLFATYWKGMRNMLFANG